MAFTPYSPTMQATQPTATSGFQSYDPNKTPVGLPQIPTPPPQLGQGSAGEFAGNAVRAVASPLVRTGGLIQSGLDQTFGRVINAVKGNGFTPTNTGQQAYDTANKIDAGASQTLAGKAGTATGVVAPYLTPMGEAGLVEKGTGLLSKASEYLVNKAAPTAIRDAGIGTAQTGDVKQGTEMGLASGLLKGTGDLVGALKKTPEQIAARNTAKVTEMISPKATPTQAKIAQTQGRFVEGKAPTMFKSGTADTIAPSQKTISATETIVKNIPDAEKMSESQLYTAVDKNITDTATKLRPQMEATPIKPETIQQLNTDWQELKKAQMADAPATEEPNVAKRQAKFESLLQKSGSSNYADLWDTAIKYDNSIPETVKKASSISSDSLQLQKQEWLDNRKVLSDAMDKSSRPEFKQMSDMYTAKSGILSKTKVDGAMPSKFAQWIKDNPKKATAIGTLLGVEGANMLGVDLKSLIP